MKKTTLNDIAKKLGVSKTLVSFVLNGRSKEMRISEEVTNKVMATAQELNYKPNQMARSLRLGKSNTIGLIVADISNPFFAKIGRVIEDEASKYGYHVIFCSSDEKTDKLTKLITVLKDKQVDGLIISPTLDSENIIKELKEENFPFVLIDRYFPKIETNHVVVDNYESSFRAVSHLLNFGYEKIGHITYNLGLIQMKQRLEGYKAALKKHGVKYDSKLVVEIKFDNLKTDTFKALDQLMSPDVNARAVYFPTNILGIHGLEYIKEKKLRIPQDLAVVCFDDAEIFKLCYTPVTAIAQPVTQIGKNALDILLNEITHEKSKKIINTILPTDFIIRESCGN